VAIHLDPTNGALSPAVSTCMHSSLRLVASHGAASLDTIRELRYRVLREPLGMPYETTFFSGDDLATTLHLVGSWDREPIGCLTLLVPEPNHSRRTTNRPMVQLRGMAVLSQHQGSGVGRALLEFVHRLAGTNGWDLWCNAREHAVPFYAKHGWRVEGDPFDIPGIGPHWKMHWETTS
jgi:GNAT superfamily N-acetyltransferase